MTDLVPLADVAARNTASLPALVADELGRHRAGWLLGFASANTRRPYSTDLDRWLAFCSEHGLDPLSTRRARLDGSSAPTTPAAPGTCSPTWAADEDRGERVVRLLRPLRLLVPLIAIGAALVVFLVFGFLAYQAGTGGGGGGLSPGVCDAGLRTASRTVGPGGAAGATAATLTAEQRQNAATIIGVARQKGAPPRAWLVALATAMQESTLRNINYGDRDSLGLFQQRPSQGWGSPAQVTDPVYSTTIFIDRLLQVPNWERLPVTVAAQTVQRSAFPNAYAKWEGLAADLVAQLAGVSDPTGCGPDSATLPDGAARTAVQFALGEVGKPYVWGATGPNTYDCSGLMLRAFQAAGIDLPRVSRDQFKAGGHVPIRQAQPGDLLFYATDPSDPATIHHVMLYMGDGQVVEAPYSGEAVRVRPVPWRFSELVPLATRPGTSPNSHG